MSVISFKIIFLDVIRLVFALMRASGEGFCARSG